MKTLPRNDAQLQAIIGADVEQGFQYALDDFVRNLEGSFHAVEVPVNTGGIGDVEGVWGPTTEGGTEPELKLEYDQSKLVVDSSTYRHSSPLGTPFRNFADLINEGQGGILNMFGGENNPTTFPRDFWGYYTNLVDLHWERWIENGLKQAGIK